MARLIVGMLLLMFTACNTRMAEPRLLWPPPPDQPRMEFIGVFSSGDDFPKTRLQQSIRMILDQMEGKSFQELACVWSDGNGMVYVADTGGRSIERFCFTSRTVQSLFKEVIFDAPKAIKIDQHGRFFILDAKKFRIVALTPEGYPLYAFGDQKSLGTPEALVFRPKGDHLYISDSHNHRIHIYNQDGQHLHSFGDMGSGDGMLLNPKGLCFNRQGHLLVADSGNARIQAFHEDGRFLYSLPTEGAKQVLKNPVDVAVDSVGHIHILDSSLAALLTFSNNGELLLVTGASFPTRHKMGLFKPTSLHIDARDRIFIADAWNRRFSIWQYLSEEYLQQYPITAEDLLRLADFQIKLFRAAGQNDSLDIHQDRGSRQQ